MIYFLQAIVKWALRQTGLPCEGDIAYSVCACSVASDSLRPLDCKPSGSSVHGVSQARILERIAISFSRGSCRPRDQIHIFYVSCTPGRFFACWAILHATVERQQKIPYITKTQCSQIRINIFFKHVYSMILFSLLNHLALCLYKSTYISPWREARERVVRGKKQIHS